MASRAARQASRVCVAWPTLRHPSTPLRGRPPSIGTGEDVLDVVVNQHNVKIPALLTVMLGQFRINLPLDSVGRLLLAQEDEVVELRGMVAISIGW
jgi:hypothetical protein